MKKIFLFFILALGIMHGRAQLLVDADYNAAGDKIISMSKSPRTVCNEEKPLTIRILISQAICS